MNGVSSREGARFAIMFEGQQLKLVPTIQFEQEGPPELLQLFSQTAK